MDYTRLRDIRDFLNMTQDDFARVLDVSNASYKAYEIGKRRIPPTLENRVNQLFDYVAIEQTKQIKFNMLAKLIQR